MRTLAILAPAVIFVGCSPPMLRGEFSILSTEEIDREILILSTSEVSGKACFNMAKAAFYIGEGVFDEAVTDALSSFEEATLLVSAEFVDTGSCVEVTGLPARF